MPEAVPMKPADALAYIEYPHSVVEKDGTRYFLAAQRGEKLLGVRGDHSGFEGQQQGDLLLGPLSANNAEQMRHRLAQLRPRPLGLVPSFGFGDRLGLATPGHVQAARRSSMAPVFAQQSVRENARTGRTPQQVLDDAMWGVFQEGWREVWGADADHLKTTAQIAPFVAAGYTMFTIDPGDHVDDGAHTADRGGLEARLATLDWDALSDSQDALEQRYLNREFRVETMDLRFDRESLWRAAAKYGRAIAHTARMYHHLVAAFAVRSPSHPAATFELEVSVDETATPTTALEHYYIAAELHRLGVHWVSLAPRFVGRFEKGVDYIGDLQQLETQLAAHAAIACVLGPYKLSLHSGSDKFSVYSLLVRHAGHLLHVKTAGTSYLEALRAVAGVEPSLFAEILAFARERYDEDKATYHVSAEVTRVPAPCGVSGEELSALLDAFDTRQVLHVTFGSVLERFGPRLRPALVDHESEHYAALEAHFIRHLAPFQTEDGA